jgi:hypothetical protein
MRHAFLIALVIGACHHDAPAPAEPAGTPPLPPASGTPIGFLIDDASELHLRDDQVAKLRDIDTSLAAELEALDAKTRAASRPSEPDPSAAPPSGGGHGGRHGGGGGMGGGGMGGGGPSGGGASGGRHRHRGGGAGSDAPASGGAAAANRAADERSADVKLALQRAFEVLDPPQQEQAKKVLAAHDVDLDVGAAPAPAPAGDDNSEPAPEP